MRLIPLITIALLLAGCHADVEELTHLHGMDEAAVIRDLGPPAFTDTFTLKHGVTLTEFYIEIHNTYAPSDPKIDGIEIKELRWDRSGYTEAVFMHKVAGSWIVLESCRWKDGIAF